MRTRGFRVMSLWILLICEYCLSVNIGEVVSASKALVNSF